MSKEQQKQAESEESKCPLCRNPSSSCTCKSDEDQEPSIREYLTYITKR